MGPCRVRGSRRQYQCRGVWLGGTPGLARANRDYLLAAAATLGGGLLLERAPAELFALESDRLSIVHVLLFALIAGFWVVIDRAERAGGSFLERASAAVARHAQSLAPAAGPRAAAVIGHLVAALIGVGIQHMALVRLLTSIAGLGCGLALYLAFFPPRFYLRRVAGATA